MLSHWILSFLVLVPHCWAGTPAPERFYHHQLVDHVNAVDGKQQEWTQRYYTWEKEFQGPGSPIFMILGGEGHIPPNVGLMYPFVTHHLAKIFGAFVIQPEHRFYGKSQPLPQEGSSQQHFPLHLRSQRVASSQDPRVKLFTPEQALYDAIRLVETMQKSLGCSLDKFSPNYCPVITVGGSYPGFLSALARIMFPNKVDMAYAASAPMGFYSQEVHANEYYDLITDVADKILPGCASAVRDSLNQVRDLILQNSTGYETELGICPGTIPSYIPSAEEGRAMLVDEVMMVVGYSFAFANMANYPPSNQTRLYRACETFTSPSLTGTAKFREFLVPLLPPTQTNCWDMTQQLPTGPNATISSGDWSGVGTGSDGESWDFQTCTLLVEAIGFSRHSMFPHRPWSLEWLNQHCLQRFGVTPQPYHWNDHWHLDDLVGANVSRILFTNGLNDGWSVGAIKANLSESLLALNFVNGAHHSDLSGKGPSDDDTPDIREGFQTIIAILSNWLEQVSGGIHRV